MLKIMRYMKPFAGSIILIFILLFTQAMADLELPAYMSRIVNVGIQQQGVEKPVPEVMRQAKMDQLLLLLDETQRQKFTDSYQILSRQDLSDTLYEAYLRQYPLIAEEPLVLLADQSDETKRQLESMLTIPLFLLSGFDQDETLEGLPDLQALLDHMAQLPEDQRQTALSQLKDELSVLPEGLIEQAAIAVVAQEYHLIGFDLSSLQNSYLFRTGGMMMLIALLGASASILVGLISARVAAGLGRDLRHDIFHKVTHFSNAEFDSFSTASLITRSTNDIQQIQMMLVMLLRLLFYAPILGIGGIYKVIDNNLSMAWIIAVAVAALMTLILVLFNIAMPKFKMIQKLVDRVNLVTREMLSGLMVIRAFNNQKQQEKKFDKANHDLTNTNLFVSRLMVLLWPTMFLIMNGTSLLIIWIGAGQVDQGAMQVGDVMAFIQYTMQIIMSFLMVSMVFIMMPRASVSAQRINEVLLVKPVINDPEKPAAYPQKAPGLIEFKEVSFRYPNAEEDVLKDISFTARPGETTAFIGSTGCGKSTLINLIPRFYDTSQGLILIDGIDVRAVKQAELRARIGYVPQKGILFSGDVASNIRYGKEDADEQALYKALETAQAADFVQASEQKLAMPIAQNGSNVSGGQRQRLAIARALAGHPDIFIFDDSFSALDYRTDAALRRALHKTTAHSTVLIVAQRIGTILHADQIIVLDEGKIVGQGKHKELLRTCAVYREIAASQLSEEELAV